MPLTALRTCVKSGKVPEKGKNERLFEEKDHIKDKKTTPIKKRKIEDIFSNIGDNLKGNDRCLANKNLEKNQ